MNLPECINSGGHRFAVVDDKPGERVVECYKCLTIAYEDHNSLSLEPRKDRGTNQVKHWSVAA